MKRPTQKQFDEAAKILGVPSAELKLSFAAMSGRAEEVRTPSTLTADAMRYRWLNRQDNFFVQINDKPVRLKCGLPLDKWIDARREEELRSAVPGAAPSERGPST